jgi:hypothetical protein
MIDIKTIDTLVISQFANCLREYFTMKGFYEVTLFDTTKYIVTNSNQIKTKTGEFLRNTTEPEIWQLGIDYERFFCVASLFRNEDLSSLRNLSIEMRQIVYLIKQHILMLDRPF